MKRDIPRVEQHFPAAAAERWKAWVGNADTLTDLPEEYDWVLDKLQVCQKCQPSTVDSEIPQEILSLREKELEPTRQVS